MSGNESTHGPDRESDDADESDDTEDLDRTVERGFTCSLCGFVMTHEVGLLRAEVQGVCFNCGAWTTQVADREELAAAAEEAAAVLAGSVLTERQALAYLLREVMDADREIAAEAMDSTPSNVDNLQRRAVEKVAEAERVVETLGALEGFQTDPESTAEE
jgi:hypothetical protein